MQAQLPMTVVAPLLMPTAVSRTDHTLHILRDDIRWLESRVQQLQDSNGERERKLAGCYEKLLGQRRQQLAGGNAGGGVCHGCWDDYIC
jgi:hypothetical protein